MFTGLIELFKRLFGLSKEDSLAPTLEVEPVVEPVVEAAPKKTRKPRKAATKTTASVKTEPKITKRK
tara:strand:- start:547 stop:747 length:201 start_codon:yes stop_codon:yes gene_type:complete